MAGKDKAVVPMSPDANIVLGPMALNPVTLGSLPVVSYSKQGVVLHNERIKTRILVDGIPVNAVVSLYVQRDAVNEDESKAVAMAADEQARKATARKAEESAKLQREKEAAYEWGQRSITDGVAAAGKLASALGALNAVGVKVGG